MWLLLAGCVVEGRDDWEILPISRAWFEEFDKSSIALIAGGMGGDAVLAWDGPYGPGAMPVRIGGGTVGLAFEFIGDLEGHDSIVPIDLSRVDAPTVADVLGTYKGSGASAAVLIGGATGRARNGRGASFREDHFGLGIGVWAGFEWIVVQPAVSEATFTTTFIDTGPTSPWTTWPTDTPSTDTGTPYTTPYTTPGTTPGTGSSDDTAAGSPSSDGGSSGGCGGDDKDEEESDPSTSSSGETTPSTPSTVRGCDQTGGGRLLSLGALAVLVAARRRRSARG